MTDKDRRGEIQDMAYQLASSEVLSRDPATMAERAGAEYAPALDEGEQDRVNVRFLDRPHQVILDAGGARMVDEEGGDVPTWATVIVLHYLAMASGSPPAGRDISFKEIRDGHLYFPNFQGRVLRRLEGAFGDDPGSLVDAARPLGGQPADHGDAAVTIRALPMVPLTFIIWGEDDEFAARAAVLFDATVEEYLPPEDIVVLCQMVAGMLAGNRREGSR